MEKNGQDQAFKKSALAERRILNRPLQCKPVASFRGAAKVRECSASLG
jgi:hypothetical protein